MLARTLHHLLLLGLGAVLYFIAALLVSADSPRDHLSIATAWQCLLLFSGVLLIGPWRQRQGSKRPVNLYWRRDMGIWIALTAIVHFLIAADVSMSQPYLAAFVNVSEAGLGVEWRNRLFSWGSIGGSLAGILLLIPFAVSSDRALRALGVGRWRRIQWLAYPAFMLTMLHGLAFQLLEARSVLLIITLVALSLLVVIVRLIYRRHSA
jgi:sulfoxide reductase heme-binding subunit YedZ